MLLLDYWINVSVQMIISVSLLAISRLSTATKASTWKNYQYQKTFAVYQLARRTDFWLFDYNNYYVKEEPVILLRVNLFIAWTKGKTAAEDGFHSIDCNFIMALYKCLWTDTFKISWFVYYYWSLIGMIKILMYIEFDFFMSILLVSVLL